MKFLKSWQVCYPYDRIFNPHLTTIIKILKILHTLNIILLEMIFLNTT